MRTTVFQEGEYWRWRIVADSAFEYVDGGNYQTEAQARAGLAEALAVLGVDWEWIRKSVE